MLNSSRIVKILVCFGFAIVAFGRNEQCSAPAQTPGTGERRIIELTKEDLFAKENWNSLQVSVLGFRLGMTRNEAEANAQKHNLFLLTNVRYTKSVEKNCDVCSAQNICPGIGLTFGNEDRTVRMEIQRVPNDADLVVRKAAITRKFRGKTFGFFDHYTDSLRVSTLGPGLREDAKPASTNSPFKGANYLYAERGVEVYVEQDNRTPDAPVELAVTFLQRGEERYKPN